MIDAHPHVRDLRLLNGKNYDGVREVGFTLATSRPVPDPFDVTVTVVARDRSGHIVTGARHSSVRLNTPLMSTDDAYTRYGWEDEIHRPLRLRIPGDPDKLTLSAYWFASSPVSLP